MTATLWRHAVDPEIARASLETCIYRDDRHEIRICDVVARLHAAGQHVWVVGGACRDWLCGEPVRDMDLSVDRPIEEAHAILRDAYPEIDPVLRRSESFGTLRWGGGAPGLMDLNILRSTSDIQNDDVWTTTFVARADLRDDALTRDFSVNTLYYACRGDGGDGTLLDPLHCGLDDVHARVLTIVTHPRMLGATFVTTLRVVQFLCRGYTAAPNTLEYLARYADRDVQGMGDRLLRWLPNHIGRSGALVDEFRDRLEAFARQQASRDVLERAFARLATDGAAPGRP